MFIFRKPSDSQTQAILAQRSGEGFSYVDVGASRDVLPDGYAVLRSRVYLGQGPGAFALGAKAIGQWKMFDVTGVRLCWPSVAMQPGSAVAVIIGHFGFWSVNICRIVYVIDEDGPVRRYGFAYGTLAEHAEKGEERFTIEWNHASDAVFYNILSFSRPGCIWTRLAYPLARWLQRRFVRDSMAAMVSAVRDSDAAPR